MLWLLLLSSSDSPSLSLTKFASLIWLSFSLTRTLNPLFLFPYPTKPHLLARISTSVSLFCIFI
jgi:hypothetical protein